MSQLYELFQTPRFRAFDANGVPLNGGLLYTYAAGTTTPQATYTDQGGLTPNSNPVVLDPYGYADVWTNNNNYKAVLKDSSGNTLWTVDNIQSFLTKFNFFQLQVNFQILYQRIVGTAAQVTGGIATDSTIASAISNANSGDAILILAGTYSESPSINKKLSIFGTGENTIISGSITFTSGSSYSLLRQIKTTNDITLNSGSIGNVVNDVFLASGKTFIDNGTANLLTGIQET